MFLIPISGERQVIKPRDTRELAMILESDSDALGQVRTNSGRLLVYNRDSVQEPTNAAATTLCFKQIYGDAVLMEEEEWKQLPAGEDDPPATGTNHCRFCGQFCARGRNVCADKSCQQQWRAEREPVEERQGAELSRQWLTVATSVAVGGIGGGGLLSASSQRVAFWIGIVVGGAMTAWWRRRR